MKLTFDITEATVVITHGTDKISLKLDEAIAHQIHGKYYEVFQGAWLNLEVTKGNWANACKALGLEKVIVVDAS